MTTDNSTPAREAILRRFDPSDDNTQNRPADVPLDWDDIGLLAYGLTFANRPVLMASAATTERYSLGPRGTWMLSLISGGVVFPHELAEVFKIGRSLVTAELVRLTEAGLIASRPGAQDRRRSELTLTAAGQTAVSEVRGEMARIISKALEGYSAEHVRLCARMLRDLRENSAQI
jgi:DNA-binding MarR family transcriptional regulator